MVQRSGWLVAVSLLSFSARAESPASGASSAGNPSEAATPASDTSTAAAASTPVSAAAPDSATSGDATPGAPPEEPAQPEPPPPPASLPPPDRSPEPSPSLSDAATTPGPSPTPLAAPREFSLELGIGANSRLSRAAGYGSDGRWGATYGIGLWLNVAKATALGLELSRVDLGHARDESGSNSIDADYAMTGAWLGGRFFPLQTDAVRLFVALRVGLALQHVNAYGLRAASSPFENARTFDCTGSHGPAFGIAGGVGSLFRLNSHLDLVARLDAHGEQLTSATVDGCAPGIGSAASLSLGLGVAYGFGGPSG